MNISVDKIAQDAINAIAKKINGLKTLNIIVAGKTGVGKSTLINAVFRERLAVTGIGRPVTIHMRRITKPGVPLTIYDTRGFELRKDVQAEVKKEIVETIIKGFAMHDINETIHCIWYCINTASNRVEPEEIAWLKELSEENGITKVPIIVVLTQSFSKQHADAIRKTLLNENLNVIHIIPVLAEDYEIDGLGTAKSYGLDELIYCMEMALPYDLMHTLQYVQIASLREKKRHAQNTVKAYSGAAAVEAAIPIPFSNIALLFSNQTLMLATITVIFGFDVKKKVLVALLLSTLGSGAFTLIGEIAVTNLLKIIPGAGTVVGGGISAVIAAAITAALGETYIEVMELVFKGEMNIDALDTKTGKDFTKKTFKDKLKKRDK